MAEFRVETVLDMATGLYRMEVYYPTDSKTPAIVGHPIYASHEHAVADAVEIFKKNIPDQPITTVRK